ncbi:hypothetical protein [Alteromonas sp. C1M14]|uniref:hypothetical protein n=1 Tax=Alteromonas sp. C1M14 TaxID=2841567 RepID=UPI001C0A46BA|nr:hypothetical protein [Alteromonas sp. C1M14]MBU2979028.1 hypothetical protein [Alteromonas sp. C1M14]
MSTEKTYQEVSIELCIGIHGVCIISIMGDDHDVVEQDILNWDPENWLDRLPDHVQPVQGVYAIDARVTYLDDIDECKYEIVATRWDGIEDAGRDKQTETKAA